MQHKTYFICTSPRSGSFLLSGGLQSTGIAGRPQEYFDHVYEPQWRKRLNVQTDEEYIPKLLEHASTPNGMRGAKVLWFQLSHLASRLGAKGSTIPEMHAAVHDAFPDLQYIWLIRRDKVAQAVSYYKAVASGVWWVMDGTESTPKGPVEFDAKKIEHHHRLIQEYDKGWQEYFRVGQIRPFLIFYEDFAANYIETLRAVLNFLQIPSAANCTIPPSRFVKQADEQSVEWARRFASSRHGIVN